MAKTKSVERLYQVKLDGGSRHGDDYTKWSENVKSTLKGKVDSFGGGSSVYVVASHHDPVTLQLLASESMSDASAAKVTVEEITKSSLKGKHKLWEGLVAGHFSSVKLN